ncbi:MAG: cellulase family glycosylhydrolase [Nitrolancea sp.]
MARLSRLLTHRWFLVSLHILVILGLSGGIFVATIADGYFNRGVASGAALSVIPNTDVNPMGVNTFLDAEVDPAKVTRELEMIKAGGYGYIRQMFPWYDIEPEPGTYWDAKNDVSSWAKYDHIVDQADARGIQIIARLDKPPRWARANAPNLDQFPDGPPDNYADYASFVATFVNRYRGRIHYIQVWNEPNLQGEWGGQPIDPAKFTELLKVAYTAAKSADPSITVLMPGLAPTDQTGPTNLSDLLFLQGMYDAGAKNYFDIATVMVYGYGYSPYDRRVEFARDNFSRPIQTHEIMVKNGDAGKAVWAAEYGWVSLPSNWSGDPSPWGKPVSQTKQADYLYQGYLRAQQEWPWMGVMCVWYLRSPDPPAAPDQANNPTRGFSIVNYDFTPTPAYTLLQQRSGEINLAFTGTYDADSRQLNYDLGWTLDGNGSTATLTPTSPGASATLDFSGTRLDLLVSGPPQDLSVTIDGHQKRLSDGSDADPKRITVSSGLSDGPHRAVITSREAGTLKLDGFIVVRRTLSSWIYPWIYAGLALTIALNLASLVWSFLGLRRTVKTSRVIRAPESSAQSPSVSMTSEHRQP